MKPVTFRRHFWFPSDNIEDITRLSIDSPNETHLMKRKKHTPLAALAGLALAAGSASAAITLDFTQSSLTFAAGTITFSSLDTAPPTMTGGQLVARTSATGSFSGVGSEDEFSFTYGTFSGSTVAGNDVSLTNINASAMASNASGIASADGDINAGGRGIFFTFDLSALAPNTGLRITDFVATSTGGSGHDAQVVVDGVSVTNMGGLTGTGLSIDITDGDFVVFRNAGTGGNNDRFRVTSITMETFVIPEPTTALLGSLGMLFLLRRRR